MGATRHEIAAGVWKQISTAGQEGKVYIKENGQNQLYLDHSDQGVADETAIEDTTDLLKSKSIHLTQLNSQLGLYELNVKPENVNDIYYVTADSADWVIIADFRDPVSTSTSGESEFTDNSDFTGGVSKSTIFGAIVEYLANEPLAIGKAAALAMNKFRELYIAGVDRIAEVIKMINSNPRENKEFPYMNIMSKTLYTGVALEEYIDLTGLERFDMQLFITAGSGDLTIETSLTDDITIPAASAAYIDATYDVYKITKLSATGNLFDDGKVLGGGHWLKIKMSNCVGVTFVINGRGKA